MLRVNATAPPGTLDNIADITPDEPPGLPGRCAPAARYGTCRGPCWRDREAPADREGQGPREDSGRSGAHFRRTASRNRIASIARHRLPWPRAEAREPIQAADSCARQPSSPSTAKVRARSSSSQRGSTTPSPPTATPLRRGATRRRGDDIKRRSRAQGPASGLGESSSTGAMCHPPVVGGRHSSNAPAGKEPARCFDSAGGGGGRRSRGHRVHHLRTVRCRLPTSTPCRRRASAR